MGKVTCHNKSYTTTAFVSPMTKGLLKKLQTECLCIWSMIQFLL